jgi:hypothetical protein
MISQNPFDLLQSYLTTISVRHFGPIQKHPTSGNVKGYPEFHVGESIFFICHIQFIYLL